MFNPSTSLIQGTIFKEKNMEKLAVQGKFQLGGILHGEKGPDLKKFSGGPILKIELFHAFLFFFNGIPGAPIILLILRPPFLILAGGEGAAPSQIKQVLGLGFPYHPPKLPPRTVATFRIYNIWDVGFRSLLETYNWLHPFWNTRRLNGTAECLETAYAYPA